MTDTNVPLEFDDSLDEVQDLTEEREVPCCFLTGRAGTGKTYEVKRRTQDEEGYGILCATTGIAAVNLNAITINSLLKYFDTKSMKDAFLSGQLIRVLHGIALEFEWLCIDEISMMDADQLDILYRAVQEANRYKDVVRPLGILLVGDFAQLPPVKARFAFQASCWDKFAANTIKLEKVWRQDGGTFLDALNRVRAGDGITGAEYMSLLTTFNTQLDTEFNGTTILPMNDQVGRFNLTALDRVQGEFFTVESRRWGKLRGEWGQNARTKEWGIPPRTAFKVGAYVMILSNAMDFSYVNGDCGHITAYNPIWVEVKLVRTGKLERITKLVRGVETRDKPDGWSGDVIAKSDDYGAYLPRPHFRGKKRTYVLGQIEYFPLRLAYASTVHKSQGLTLDRVQIDYRNHFFGSPAMLYVALSRCRTAEGLRLVGSRETFAKQCKADERVREWL